ncbi:MAG TPA: PfkB family carbohydrate kinase [Patescibacteria group bacterium]
MDFPGAFGDHILPDQIHKINLSFIVNNFEKRRGGTAGNVSYSLGLLDIPNLLFSIAGKDYTEYDEALQKLPSIDTSWIYVDHNKYTATGFAMTDKTNNQIWGYFYGAADGIADLQLKKVAKQNDLVLIGPSGAKGSMSLVKQCIEQKLEYMFDPGFILTQVSDAELALGVKHAAYIIGNDYEIDVIKSRVKQWKKLFAGKVIITTLGEKGAIIETKKKTSIIKVVNPTKVVDPTGAGDAWRAGFLAGLHNKLNLKTCGQMGSTAASFAIEKYGTQEHIFTKEEFIIRYRQHFGNLLSL